MPIPGDFGAIAIAHVWLSTLYRVIATMFCASCQQSRSCDILAQFEALLVHEHLEVVLKQTDI